MHNCRKYFYICGSCAYGEKNNDYLSNFDRRLLSPIRIYCKRENVSFRQSADKITILSYTKPFRLSSVLKFFLSATLRGG